MVELGPPHTPESRALIKEDLRDFMRIYSKTHPATSQARIKFLELGALDNYGLGAIDEGLTDVDGGAAR